MSHFLFVRDEDDVLGVWEASDEVAALKLRLSLELTYPRCRTHVMAAPDFQSVKASVPEVDFEGIEPQPVSGRGASRLP